MDSAERYVNEKKVAEITGFSLAKLRNDRSLGRGIPYCKVGSAVRYPLSDVLEFMEAHRIHPRNAA